MADSLFLITLIRMDASNVQVTDGRRRKKVLICITTIVTLIMTICTTGFLISEMVRCKIKDDFIHILYLVFK